MKVFKIWASPRDEIGLVTDMHSLSRISQQLLLISYKNAPALLFILGLTWVFLFSAVNVTTGELKPRGLYVDEHALLVQSQMFRKPKVQSAPYIDFNNTSLCHFLDLSLLQCSEHTESKDDNFMTEIRVLPSKSKVLLESTVLVIHYTPEDVCIIKEVLSLVGSVAANLHHANWNARQVIILLVPKASNAGSGENSGFIINSWLQRHHKPSLSQLHENELNLLSARDQHPLGSIGMLREAYVIDLTDSDLCTSSDHLNNQFGFNALGLLHTGSNGVLPNMDMLSYPLSMYPEVMHTESEKCAIELHNSSSSKMLTYLDRTNEDSVIARLIRKIFLVWNEVDSNVYLKGYKDRSMGLLCSIYTLASGIPTGQHAHFLDYNIDSVTIKPERQRIRQRQRLKGDRTGQQSGKKGAAKTPASYINDSSEKADYGREKLLEVAYSLLYISNNLHGIHRCIVQIFILFFLLYTTTTFFYEQRSCTIHTSSTL